MWPFFSLVVVSVLGSAPFFAKRVAWPAVALAIYAASVWGRGTGCRRRSSSARRPLESSWPPALSPGWPGGLAALWALAAVWIGR